MSNLPPPRPNGRFTAQDIEVIFEGDHEDKRIVGTPSAYDIERMLEILRKDYRVDVYFTRRHLRWLMKKTYKRTGMIPRNPWWMPKNM